MTLASPRGLPRSPRHNDAVLKAEIKLNREEAARLQESSATIEEELKVLRDRLKQLKRESKREILRRNSLIENEEKKHAEAVNNATLAFTAEEAQIKAARQQMLEHFRIATSQQLDNLKLTCDDVRNTIQDDTNIAHIALDDLCALAHIQSLPKCSIGEPTAFEIPTEEEETTPWYAPQWLVQLLRWIRSVLH